MPDRSAPLHRPIRSAPYLRSAHVLVLTLLFAPACTGGNSGQSSEERLGPGMATVNAEIETCAFDAEPYRCTVRVERTLSTGPQTPYPAAGSRLAVDVYASHFRDMTGDALRSRLEAGRTIGLTLQAQEPRGDPDRTWTLVRF